jgi:hypothetical protein
MEDSYALDDRGAASDPMAAWNGEFLHVRRIHSHPARTSHHSRADPTHPGQESFDLALRRANDKILNTSGRIQMTQNTCEICHKPFNSEQELREHKQNAHPTARKEGDRPSGEQPQRRDDKIAS